MSASTNILTFASLQNDPTATNDLNQNFAAINTALGTCLSTMGQSPNQMQSTLDMNSNRVINLDAPISVTEPVTLGYLNSILAGGNQTSGLINGVPVSAAMQPVVDASTLSAARLLLGGTGAGIAFDASNNYEVKFPITTVTTSQTVTTAFHMQNYIANAANLTFTLPRANTTFSGFGFILSTLASTVTLAVNASDKVFSGSLGTGVTIPTNSSCFITTDAASNGTWIILGLSSGGSGSTASDTFNVKAYGATGNGTTDDTSSIQAAINAAQAFGKGKVYIPPGTYLVSSTLNVTTGITIQGAGGCSVYETTVKGSTIKSTVTSGVILNCLTDDSVRLYDFSIQMAGAGAVTALNIDTDHSTSVNANIGSIIRGLNIFGNSVVGSCGISSLDSAGMLLDGNYVWNTYYGLIKGCNTAPGSGDDSVINNTFSGQTNGVVLENVGGVRFVNNKINCNPSVASNGIVVQPTLINALGMSPLIIADNSIEQCSIGILFQRSATATMKAGNIAITGNEISAGFSGQAVCIESQTSGGDSSEWILGVAISGNYLFAGNSATCVHLNIDAMKNVLFASNVLDTNATATSVSQGPNCTNIIVGTNCKASGVT